MTSELTLLVNEELALKWSPEQISGWLLIAAALHTITADNGKESAFHERITEELGAQVYLVHPYHFWGRGLNENTNGLLRQYWPKSSDFKKVDQEEVEAVIVELNNRPRKTLGFETPADLMQNYLADQQQHGCRLLR